MDFFPSQVLAEKGKFWNPTLSDIAFYRIKTTEPKLLTFVSCFSGEDTPSTDTSHDIPLLPEVCRSVLLLLLLLIGLFI